MTEAKKSLARTIKAAIFGILIMATLSSPGESVVIFFVLTHALEAATARAYLFNYEKI